MNKFMSLTATFALLYGGTTIVFAAEAGEWVTCKDGLKMHGGGACSNHGGVLIEANKSTPVKTTPIDTTKGFVPKQTATTAKSKTPSASASKSTQKKAASTTTRNPTAKCLDGAMYFSTERKGACSKHGGVDKWFGW
jgi:hypothetical protein